MPQASLPSRNHVTSSVPAPDSAEDPELMGEDLDSLLDQEPAEVKASLQITTSLIRSQGRPVMAETWKPDIPFLVFTCCCVVFFPLDFLQQLLHRVNCDDKKNESGAMNSCRRL